MNLLQRIYILVKLNAIKLDNRIFLLYRKWEMKLLLKLPDYCFVISKSLLMISFETQ